MSLVFKFEMFGAGKQVVPYFLCGDQICFTKNNTPVISSALHNSDAQISGIETFLLTGKYPGICRIRLLLDFTESYKKYGFPTEKA